MIKFYRTGVLGGINSEQNFVTREVLIHVPIRNWIGILNRENPEKGRAVWAEIEAEANKPHAVSNDIQVNRKVIGDKAIALIAGTKINGNSPATGKIQGQFKYIIVEDADLVETLRQELGVKIKHGLTWEAVQKLGEIKRR